jgi:glycosyltransferase involved in cell wall biosynthesis
LRVATYFGLLTAAFSFVFAVWIMVKAALYGDPVAGWPTMMVVILFLGGIQLIALGLIGEYLGRLYDEAKQRPLYLVDIWQPGAGGVFSSQQPGTKGELDAHVTPTVGKQDS